MSNNIYRVVGRQMGLWTLETVANTVNFLVPWWVAGKIADNTDPSIKEVQDATRGKLDAATNFRPINAMKSLYQGMDKGLSTVLNFTDRTLNRSVMYQRFSGLPFVASFERRYNQMKNYVLLNAFWQRFVKPATKEYLWDKFAIIPVSYLAPFFGGMVRLADEKMKTLLAATYFRGGSYNLDALENSFGGYIYSFQQFFAKFPAFFKASEMKPVVEGVFVSQEKIEQIAEQHLEMLVSLGSQAISAFSSATQYGVQSLDWSCAKIGHVLDLGVHVASGIKNYGECLTHVNSIGLVNCTLDTGTHAYEFTKHQGEPVLNWTANTASDLAQWAHKNVWEEQLKVILKAGLQHAGSAKDVGVNKLQDLLQEGLKNSSELLAICQPYTLPAMGGAIVLGLAAYGTRTAVQKLWSNAGTVNNNNHTIQVGLPAAVLPAP